MLYSAPVHLCFTIKIKHYQLLISIRSLLETSGFRKNYLCWPVDEFSKPQRPNVLGVRCGTVHFWHFGLNQEQLKFSNFKWYLKLQSKI